jgi:hypothetical protein
LRIALLSFYDEAFAPLAALTFPGLKAYCEKWGYTPYFGQPFANCDPRNGFDRFVAVYGLFEQGYDAVMWIDADAMITNHHIRIEDRLGDEKFVIAADLHGINSGVFIARNHLETRELVLSMINLGEKLLKDHPFREQECLNRYLGFDRYRRMVTVLPQRMLNAVVNAYYQRPEGFAGDWRPGDWILHFPGISMADRLRIVPEYVAQIVR